MGQKLCKHFEINVVLQSVNHIFPASCNFFCTIMKDLSNLIHNKPYEDEDKNVCDNLTTIFYRNEYLAMSLLTETKINFVFPPC